LLVVAHFIAMRLYSNAALLSAASGLLLCSNATFAITRLYKNATSAVMLLL